MTRRYENILLNGVSFRLDTQTVATHGRVGFYGDIEDAYANPSHAKRAIYNDWWHWFRQHNGDCGVQSKNCNFFTIGGYVEDENGQKYQCYITASKHECWKVVEA